MQLVIDNLDGTGPHDYTAAVSGEGPITLQRQLNAPSRCTALIVEGAAGLALPRRGARITVSSGDGTTLFTGYLATEPVREYAGTASEGPVYRARLSAVSDEWLLDKQGSGAAKVQPDSFALTGGQLLERLADLAQSGSGRISVATAGTLNNSGVFRANPGVSWSANAAAAAGAAYASYRALSDIVKVETAGTTTHTLSDSDGTLSISQLALGNVRELANDITVSGAIEATTYVQEHFFGDGTTATFPLSAAAFRIANRVLAQDSFTEAVIDRSAWQLNDPGSHLSITAAGLTFSGGNGADGVTTLLAPDAIEMAGVVVAELTGVSFGAGSEGMLAAFYGGPPVLASCFAGFRVRQNSASTVVVPIVNGAEAGTVFTPVSGHTYTLRVRLHCREMQRVPQRYFCMIDGTVESFGSLAPVDAAMYLVFELRDETSSSATPVTVLLDTVALGTPVAVTPGTCAFAVGNSENLIGSVASVSVTRTGSLWVTSTTSTGASTTRSIGLAGEGVDCEASYGTSGGEPASLTFFSGRIPAADEHIVVSYRTSGRSIARLEDPASIAAEAASGLPGTARWLGKVLEPVARSSADCEAAAAAILAFSTSRACAVAGKYTTLNPAVDIWPGDVLRITSAGVQSSLLVRSVEVADGHSVPETLGYAVHVANDWATEWADGLGLRLSESIAADALLPPSATSGPPGVLANLQALTVTSLTTTAIGIDAGTAPPLGGGFEVRRRENGFGTDNNAVDLVLRSPVRSFTIPRAAQVERYAIRMYDGSTPPLYSRWSTVVAVRAPTS